MGEAARRRAVEELTWKAVAGRYRDAYVSALEAAGSAAERGVER